MRPFGNNTREGRGKFQKRETGAGGGATAVVNASGKPSETVSLGVRSGRTRDQRRCAGRRYGEIGLRARKAWTSLRRGISLARALRAAEAEAKRMHFSIGSLRASQAA